jgi:CRP-like cAMP-binding protein
MCFSNSKRSSADIPKPGGAAKRAEPLGCYRLSAPRAVTCLEDGHVLSITYEKLLEIYFQNPQFGYYFVVLTSQRLLENIARLEGVIAQNKLAQPSPN